MRIFIGLAVLAMVATPAWANLLSDSEGSFEDPWPSQPNPWQGSIERDSGIWGPGGPACGDHYGSVQKGGAGTRTAYLTSIYVDPSTTVTLTGVEAGGTNAADAAIFVQLLDGSSDGSPVVAEWRLEITGTQGHGWTAFQVGPVHMSDGHVTIKIGLTIHSGWSNGTAIHVDCLDLTPEPASMALFALAGLPLLLRRRR